MLSLQIHSCLGFSSNFWSPWPSALLGCFEREQVETHWAQLPDPSTLGSKLGRRWSGRLGTWLLCLAKANLFLLVLLVSSVLIAPNQCVYIFLLGLLTFPSLAWQLSLA